MDVDVLQQEFEALAAELTSVRPGECLWHYVDRMLEEHGCSRHWFTERWVRERPGLDPGPTVRWLKSRGGYCDCESLMNALTHSSPDVLRRGLMCSSVASWCTRGEGCEDEDCRWVDCDDQEHGARPPTPGGCTGTA